jgi:hypothetical protein
MRPCEDFMRHVIERGVDKTDCTGTCIKSYRAAGHDAVRGVIPLPAVLHRQVRHLLPDIVIERGGVGR